MLTLHLRPFVGAYEHTTRSTYFASVHGSVKTADGQDFANQKAGVWHRDGNSYVAVVSEDRVLVRFEHPVSHDNVNFRPYQGLQLIDGAMWAGDESPVCLARFDDALMAWHLQTKPAPAMPRYILTMARWV